MRPLVLAALLAALVGCSIPYQGTSFAALPKPEQMAEGEHRETNEHEEAEGDHRVGIALKMYSPDTNESLATNLYGGDKDDVFPGMEMTQTSDRTASVFPKTAQPSATRPLNEEGYWRGDAQTPSSEGVGE